MKPNRVSLVLSFLLLLSAMACSSSFAPLSNPPEANEILANARRAARDLDSYRVTRTTIETTVYPQNPARNIEYSQVQTIAVASERAYSIDQPAFGHEFISIDGTGYSRSDRGAWQLQPQQHFSDEFDLLPGEIRRPPAHPMGWLDSRGYSNPVFVEERTLYGQKVFVVRADVPFLPLSAGLDDRIPSDELVFHISAETFQVLRIEIDQNILDSLREDSGYQVIPGVVEIDTRDVYEYSNQNEEIEVVAPSGSNET